MIRIIRFRSDCVHSLKKCINCSYQVFGFHQLWYALSKTLAEEAAWKFAKENGIDLVALNPGMAIGPLLQPTLNSSSEPLLKLFDGTLTEVE